jgi:hypothetical protein
MVQNKEGINGLNPLNTKKQGKYTFHHNLVVGKFCITDQKKTTTSHPRRCWIHWIEH